MTEKYKQNPLAIKTRFFNCKENQNIIYYLKVLRMKVVDFLQLELHKKFYLGINFFLILGKHSNKDIGKGKWIRL